MARRSAIVAGSATAVVLLALWLTPAAGALEPWQLWRFPITGVGTTPGADYTQTVTDQPVDLDGLELRIGTDEGWWCNRIPALPTGQAYTLLSTTGGLTGAYEGVPDGAVVSAEREGHDCGSAHAARLAIHYHEEGSVQTVTATVVEGSPIPVSSTRLERLTHAPQTNQPFEFRALVTTSPAEFGPGPIGAIAGIGASIECQPREIAPPFLEAVCVLPYSRWGNPGNPGEAEAGWVVNSAAFTGSTGVIAGSEGTEEVDYRVGETTTTISYGPPAGGTVTVTADVAPRYSGPDVPEGEVRFLLGGDDVAGCERVAVVPAGSHGRAQCRVPVAALPATVEASFADGKAFGPSSSGPVGVSVPVPAPPSTDPITSSAVPLVSPLGVTVGSGSVHVLAHKVKRRRSACRRRPARRGKAAGKHRRRGGVPRCMRRRGSHHGHPAR